MKLNFNNIPDFHVGVVSGYFNPIHKGHLEYFINAKAQGDLLFVIVNSDHQRALKGSKEFQKEGLKRKTIKLPSLSN